MRPREHLTPGEVDKLIATARTRGRGRCSIRDAAAILLAYSHGLRVSELVTLQQYLGHRSIQHTVRYTELAADRFAGLWHD
jgi:type 1 fimbriae regulatory protein FimB/type 1 fimbriae regulatory protein FimE